MAITQLFHLSLSNQTTTIVLGSVFCVSAIGVVVVGCVRYFQTQEKLIKGKICTGGATTTGMMVAFTGVSFTRPSGMEWKNEVDCQEADFDFHPGRRRPVCVNFGSGLSADRWLTMIWTVRAVEQTKINGFHGLNKSQVTKTVHARVCAWFRKIGPQMAGSSSDRSSSQQALQTVMTMHVSFHFGRLVCDTST